MEEKNLAEGAVYILLGFGLIYLFITISPVLTVVGKFLLAVILVTGLILIGFGLEHASGMRVLMPKWLRITIAVTIYFVMGLVWGLTVYLTFIDPILGAGTWIVFLIGLSCLVGLFLFHKTTWEPVLTGKKFKRAPSLEAKIRPFGLTVISILWLLGGIFKLYTSCQYVTDCLRVLPALSVIRAPEWLQFGVLAEFALNLLIFSLGFVQMFTIYGLWKGKSWSYKPALTIPIISAFSEMSGTILYFSTPVELNLNESVNWIALGMSIFYIIIYWSYLRRSHVKEYLEV